MRRLLSTVLFAIAVVVAAPTAAFAVVPSDTSDFTFDSFDAEYTLTKDDAGHAQLAVVETIVARFPDFDQNRGIIRAIPDRYNGVPLQTVVDSIVDANGNDVPYELGASDGFVELALGTDEFVHGATTYVISYRQSDVVGTFSETASEEFYWDVNGTGWDQPFGRVSAVVHIDPALATALTGNSACYVGADTVAGDCQLNQSDALTFDAKVSSLAARENLTVAIGFTVGTFVIPEPTLPTYAPGQNPGPSVPVVFPPIPAQDHVFAGIGALVAAGGIAFAGVMRRRAGGNAKGRGVIIPQYSEPADISILQSAALLGRGTSGLPAAIVRLAVRKNLRILAYAVVEGATAPYTLQYLGAEKTSAVDRQLLGAIFGAEAQPGTLRPFGTHNQSLMTALTSVANAEAASLIPQGFQRPAKGRALGCLIPGLMAVLTFILFSSMLASFAFYASASPALIIALILSFIGMIVAAMLASRPAQLTEKGALAKEYLQGMQMYLNLAEKDRLQVLQSPQGAERVDAGDNLQVIKLYERLLPWAVLWGVENQWMKELAVRVETLGEQPDWFLGTNGFSTAGFTAAMGGFSTTLTPPPPPPSSSSNGWGGSGGSSFSSGGSFGGGFSGGGGGGGGGGGR